MAAEAAFGGKEGQSVPHELHHLWMQFLEINLFRGTDLGMETVPHSLTNEDICAWAKMTGRQLSGFDLSVFARLEQAFWRVYHGGGKDEQPKSMVKQFSLIADTNKKVRKVSVGK